MNTGVAKHMFSKTGVFLSVKMVWMRSDIDGLLGVLLDGLHKHTIKIRFFDTTIFECGVSPGLVNNKDALFVSGQVIFR